MILSCSVALWVGGGNGGHWLTLGFLTVFPVCSFPWALFTRLVAEVTSHTHELLSLGCPYVNLVVYLVMFFMYCFNAVKIRFQPKGRFRRVELGVQGTAMPI